MEFNVISPTSYPLSPWAKHMKVSRARKGRKAPEKDIFSGLRIHWGIVPCIVHLPGPKEGRTKALRVSRSSDFCGGFPGTRWTLLPLAVGDFLNGMAGLCTAIGGCLLAWLWKMVSASALGAVDNEMLQHFCVHRIQAKMKGALIVHQFIPGAEEDVP